MADLVTMADIYKRKFMGKKLAQATMRDHVRYKRMTKKGGFTGVDAAYHIITGNPQGVGGTFAGAQANVEDNRGKQPVVVRRAKYSVVRLDHESILASKGSDGAFYDLVVHKTNGITIEFGDNLAFDLYRDGTGQRGKISAINGNVLTLTNSDHVRNFKLGMTVIGDNNSNGLTPKAGTAKIEGIGQTTVTLNNIALITGLAVDDFLFRSTDPGTCCDGLATCTPLVEPTAGDSFRGMDRSVHAQILAGSRVSDTNNTIEENLGLGAIKCSQVGLAHVPHEAYLNPINFFQVQRRQGAKVMYTSDKTRAKIGFQYIEIVTATGTMTVYSDPDCPTDLGYGENPENDYIKHLDEYPHVVMNGKDPLMMMGAELSFEGRMASFGNYVQEDPAAHFVISI